MATNSLTTGKIVDILFTQTLDTFESQQMLLDKVSLFTPNAADMQNAGNTIWRTVRQQRPIIPGWDLTGLQTGIIQQVYPAVLGTPSNDFVEQRIDDMRDMQFWKDAGVESGMKQASYLNSSIASTIALQGSLFIRSNASSGYNFIAAQQALMNERQLPKGQRYSLLNDRDTLTFAQDLAGRQTLQGRPATTWDTGQIGANVAEFDVYTGSFLPNLVGGASPNTTVTGNQSFAPTAGSVNSTTLAVTNQDYRSAVIPVAASSGYIVGDKVRFQNPNNVDVYAVGLDTKESTGLPMTFTIISKPDATSIEVFPRPIAAVDGALTAEQLAYANINTRILSNALVVRLNVDASVKTDLFWDKKAVEVLGGSIPAQLFKEFAGKKVISETMKNGLTMYMVYDGDITTMNFKYRLFVWWGVTMRDPSMAGVACRYTAT